MGSKGEAREEAVAVANLEWTVLAQIRASVITRTQAHGFDGLPW